MPAQSFAQFVLNTRDYAARERTRSRLLEILPREFSDLRWRINRIENGPPVGYVLHYRVSGQDRQVLRAAAEEIAAA